MQRTTQKDDRQLLTRLRAAPTPANREAAVKRYLPLARGLAARYRDAAEPAEDLEQVAAIGLLNAIDRFDPACGIAFTSYAVPTILGELCRHFRDRTWALRIPRSHRELIRKIEQADDELAMSLGRHPTVAGLSRRLGLDEEPVLDLVTRTLARDGEETSIARTFGQLDPTSRLAGR